MDGERRGGSAGGGDPDRHESEKERLDRNLNEMLGGLRVALPGVQVLFAFLLILPFQQGFVKVTSFQEKIYFATLMCVALGTVCLIAPTPRHRIQFRQDDKAWIVFSGNRLTVVGLAFLGLGILGAVILISDFLFGTATAAVAGVVVGVALAWVWFGAPLRRRLGGAASSP